MGKESVYRVVERLNHEVGELTVNQRLIAQELIRINSELKMLKKITFSLWIPFLVWIITYLL